MNDVIGSPADDPLDLPDRPQIPAAVSQRRHLDVGQAVKPAAQLGLPSQAKHSNRIGVAGPSLEQVGQGGLSAAESQVVDYVENAHGGQASCRRNTNSLQPACPGMSVCSAWAASTAAFVEHVCQQCEEPQLRGGRQENQRVHGQVAADKYIPAEHG